MAESVQERITEYKRRLAELEEDARSWQKIWKEVQTYVLPNMGKLDGAGEKANDGDKKGQSIINSSPTRACYELAAGMHNHMCSPVKNWFKLSLEERDLLEQPGVRPWLEDCTKAIRTALQKSNFYDVALTILRELCGFGTGCMIIDTSPLHPLIFVPMTIGEFYLSLDEEMRPDTIYRKISLTVTQLVRKFGIDNVSAEARSAYEHKNWAHRVTVIHVIQPRMTRELEQGDPLNMAWESVYFEESVNGKFLRESGYESWPFAAPTWARNSTDTYGRGPFIDNMPDIKGLQWLERKKYEALDKMINPPTVMPSAFKQSGGISLIPGAQNSADGPQAEGIRPVYQIQYPIDHVSAEIQNVITRIRENTFVTLFRIISNIERQMTATEVRQRIIEGLTLLGPVVLQTEGGFFDVVIHRAFDVLWARGELPEPPPILQGREWTIEYTGFLAQAQKAADAGVIDQLLSYLIQAANAQSLSGPPEVLDKIDADQLIDELGEMLGVPAKIIRSDDEVHQIRMQRAAQQQQQAALAQMQTMEPLAKAAKTASETKVGQGRRSLLDAITGA